MPYVAHQFGSLPAFHPGPLDVRATGTVDLSDVGRDEKRAPFRRVFFRCQTVNDDGRLRVLGNAGREPFQLLKGFAHDPVGAPDALAGKNVLPTLDRPFQVY